VNQEEADKKHGSPGWARRIVVENCREHIDSLESRMAIELMYAYTQGYHDAKNEMKTDESSKEKK